MAHYFLLLDENTFQQQIAPALAACWQARSFAPCRPLAESLRSASDEYRANCFAGPETPYLARVTQGLRFDRHIWRLLVGEVLLIAAAEVPEIQTAPETLCCLLAPDRYAAGLPPQECCASVHQAHFGTRDLRLGAAVYRPDQVAWNSGVDVARLASYLSGIDAQHWRTEDLAGLRDLTDESDRAEELEFVREWFPALCDLYRRARDHRQIVICEVL